ncbi:MAG: winged helix-turn-helix domain-containing protein [Alphaproteobacteria bacterium]|nr:winged helix-turn-helix domain-containing protein [Alphaproteobacteria bacterium]
MLQRSAEGLVAFGSFRLDRRTGELCRVDGERFSPVPLGRRALDVLGALIDGDGRLVTKQEIMDAAWPNLTVEDSNLTVQISGLRRALDGGAEPSCIQTVPGRGYRFALPVSAVTDEAAPQVASIGANCANTDAGERGVGPGGRRALLWGGGAFAAVVAGGAIARFGSPLWRSHASPARMSAAVLPFAVEGDDPLLARFAEAVTETLIADLPNPWSLGYFSPSLIPPRNIMLAAAARSSDPRVFGTTLNVRYVLSGVVRGNGGTVQANAEVTVAETGVLIWSRQYEDAREAALDDPTIMARWIRPDAVFAMIWDEAARSLRERPHGMDELDLMLQAKAWEKKMPDLERFERARFFYERVLELNPRAANALGALAEILLGQRHFTDVPAGGYRAIERLIERGEAVEPDAPDVMMGRALLLFATERWAEAAAAYERLLAQYPIANGPESMIAHCYERLGRAEESEVLLKRALRKLPRNSWFWKGFADCSLCMMLQGRFQEAIDWSLRSLAIDPETTGRPLARLHLTIASAQALLGHLEEAHRSTVEAARAWPYVTVRGFWTGTFGSDRFAQQISRILDGLRLAGLRDHAPEDEDFGIAPDSGLSAGEFGKTPLTIAGARTIGTAELTALHAKGPVSVIDVSAPGRSIPGATGLAGAGSGGTFQDNLQPRVETVVARLTSGDKTARVVAMGWNPEHQASANLARRLVAANYTRVLWYRGGQESWQAAGNPVENILPSDW